MVSTTWWYRITESVNFNQYSRRCFLDERDNKMRKSFNHVRSLGESLLEIIHLSASRKVQLDVLDKFEVAGT